MSRSGEPRVSSRPRTGVRTPKRTAGGDNPLSLSLDDELFTVLQKEYEPNEEGKNEAIQDAKAVLHEVSQEPLAQAMDKVIPRFLAAETEDVAPKRPISIKKRAATPRHAMLTARPPARGKTRQHLSTEEAISVPNIPESMATDVDGMRATTSAPTIASTSRQLSTSSSDYVTEKTTATNLKVTGMEEMEDLPRTTTAMSSITDGGSGVEGFTGTHPRTCSTTQDDATKVEDEDEELPFTENLLEMPSDSEDADDIWKSDIVELTKMKSAPKGKTTGGADVLELKYKEPEWPHQLLLNQILVKLPRLTHLVLDGSELRFVRDLGSSLMSLITLSICDCGLRSLDGVTAMPNLRTLIARKNRISIPTQCCFLNRLSYLDLSSNPISSFDEFGHLRQCGELRILKLHDTPIAADSKFNKRMKRIVPQLKEIHPPRFDMNQIKLIQEQPPEEETKDFVKSKDQMMPSLSYDKVMLDEPKSGIAYQKIPKAKKQQQRREAQDVNMGIFMGPKFLQHLEETMPPSTAEADEEILDQDDQSNAMMTDENENVVEEIFKK